MKILNIYQCYTTKQVKSPAQIQSRENISKLLRNSGIFIDWMFFGEVEKELKYLSHIEILKFLNYKQKLVKTKNCLFAHIIMCSVKSKKQKFHHHLMKLN